MACNYTLSNTLKWFIKGPSDSDYVEFTSLVDDPGSFVINKTMEDVTTVAMGGHLAEIPVTQTITNTMTLFFNPNHPAWSKIIQFQDALGCDVVGMLKYELGGDAWEAPTAFNITGISIAKHTASRITMTTSTFGASFTPATITLADQLTVKPANSK